MTAPYTFTWHAPERVLEARMAGAWTLADVEQYKIDLLEFVATHAEDQPALLVDLSEFPAQSGPVADAWQAGLTQLRASVLFSRSAVVMASRAVSRMQASRIARESEAAIVIFADRDSAFSALTQPVSR